MSRLPNTLKDLARERTLFQRRVWIVGVGIGILGLFLIGRLGYLQLYQHRFYAILAEQNQLRTAPIEPSRGLIFDRNGVLLAGNKLIYNLVITPNQVSSIASTLKELSQVIKITPKELQEFYHRSKKSQRFTPVLLHRNVTEEEMARFALDRYHFPGVSIQSEFFRYYPLGAALAASVGYIGRINKQELRNLDPFNYSSGHSIGKSGVEKYYESQLRGKIGYQRVAMNARGETVRVLKTISPLSGDNVFLTLDSHLQLKTAQILEGHRGAVVALNPQNGEILALVSSPSFDPNLFVGGIDKSHYYSFIKDKTQPLYNRALEGQYHPASVIKPFLSVGALLWKITTPSRQFYDTGKFRLRDKGRVFHNFRGIGHGFIDLVQAITVSSDCYFYDLNIKMGIDRIYEILDRFGYGKPTGVDLPEQAKGLVPSRAWKKKVLNQGWYPGDTLNTGIGQGFLLATPLQMAVGSGALAMFGQCWRPHILLSRQIPSGLHVLTKPKLTGSLEVDQEIWNVVRSAMGNVVNAPNGTAHRYFHDAHYSLAGKTGTAQIIGLKPGDEYKRRDIDSQFRENSLFIAFAPLKNPEIALAVVIQNGTIPAAKVARKVLDAYFQKR